MATHSSRRWFIGGSDARIIMGDGEAALLRLWQEKRGEVEPEDLSGNLIVQLGVVTEPLNRHWFQRHNGRQDVQRWIAGRGEWGGRTDQSGKVDCCHRRRRSRPAPPNGGRKRGETIFALDGAAFEAGGLPRPRFHR